MVIPLILAVLQGQPVAEVRVLNADFELVRVIDDPGALAEFQARWEDRTIASSPVEPCFSFKVDIVTESGSTRWLYDPAGYARVLTKRESPLFCFSRREALLLFLLPPSGAEQPERDQ